MVAMGQAYVLRCATAHAGFDGCDCGHRLRTGKPAGCGSRRLTGSLRCSVSEGSKRRAATVDRGHTHPRRGLRSIGGTLSAAWSADGSALSVVDHWASDSARAYIHDAGTLRRLDLGSRILSVDPDAKRFARGHVYFDVDRWEGLRVISTFKAIPTKRRWCASISLSGEPRGGRENCRNASFP